MRVKSVLRVVLILGMSTQLHAAPDSLDAETALANADTYTVLVKTTIRYPFGDDLKGRSRGAGFVIDRERGWILTNAHVASRSVATISVSFHGGDPIHARRIYIDPFLDLAVLAVSPSALPKETTEARLECGDLPRAGVPVVAYGHPGGHLFTGTKGIVSGVSSKYDTEFLQTDAPINPGNSGGPLINLLSGQITGINTAGISNLQNTNFALASRFACPIVELLRAGKDPSPPKADWRFFTESDERATVKVAHPGKFGERLGINAGDVIVSINGSSVKPANETHVLHYMRGSLSKLRIDVQRQGKLVSLTGHSEPEPRILDKTGLVVAGMLITEFDKRIAREVEFKGVWVEYVDKGSEAESAEITAQTILVSVNGVPTPTLSAAKAALSAAAGNKGPSVLVLKNITGSMKASGLFSWLERRLTISEVKEITIGEHDQLLASKRGKNSVGAE
jgi:serine protease Do